MEKESCPERGVLAAFSRGELDLDSFEQVAAHVQDCASCQTLLPELEGAADALVAALRQVKTALPAAAPTAMAGSRLPGYELLDEIGRGGMGIVYRARDLRLKREVAIKLLQERYAAASGMARRFFAEAQITGQLQHPGIPAVHELGTLPDGRPFLAMKLVKGRTLESLLHERPQPGHERGRFLAIFEHLCQAVGYAHAHRVIHRDLKPSNVMVGAFGEVQVMDWGLAKVLPSDELSAPREDEIEAEKTALLFTEIETSQEASAATQPGQVMGTPAFMSPEQAGGEVRKLDARSDVFGLGAMLCVLLTGAPPYRGKGTNEVRLQAVRGELQDAFARLEGCGAEPELLALAKRCLAFRQEERPANARAVAEEVAQLRAAAEERARQAELERERVLVREAEQRKRRRVWLGLAATLLLALAGGSGVWLWLERQEADRQAAAARQAQERHRKAAAELTRATALRQEARKAARESARGLLAEAQAAAQLADELLRQGSAEPGLSARLRSVKTDLQQAERDWRMVANLEEARLRGAASNAAGFDLRASDTAYAHAFAEYGIDLAQLKTEEAAARLAQQAIRVELAAALDYWATLKREPAEARRLRALARAADQDPQRNRVRAALDRKDREALRQLAVADRLGSLQAPTLVLLGKALHEQGERKHALAVLREARRLFPGDFWVNVELARAYFQLPGDGPPSPYPQPEAVRFFTAAITLRSQSAAVHEQLGLALYLGGMDRAEASAAFRKAIELNPELVVAHVNLCYALQSQGRYREALAAYHKALEMPTVRQAIVDRKGMNLAWPKVVLGDALSKEGRANDALVAYQEAVRLDPHHREAHAKIGKLLKRMGRP